MLHRTYILYLPATTLIAELTNNLFYMFLFLSAVHWLLSITFLLKWNHQLILNKTWLFFYTRIHYYLLQISLHPIRNPKPISPVSGATAQQLGQAGWLLWRWMAPSSLSLFPTRIPWITKPLYKYTLTALKSLACLHSQIFTSLSYELSLSLSFISSLLVRTTAPGVRYLNRERPEIKGSTGRAEIAFPVIPR